MTGTRFGEATALTVADVDVLSKPPTARINKAWKRDGRSRFYVGATKTGAGKRTIGLNPALVELLIPLVASRPGKELVFTTPKGGRIIHKLYWHHYWGPAVRTAQTIGLTKNPRIHDLRHTHASWLIQDGVPLFTVSRRLGHASTRTTEQVYGHLMPEALQTGADATERSVPAFHRWGCSTDGWLTSLSGDGVVVALCRGCCVLERISSSAGRLLASGVQRQLPRDVRPGLIDAGIGPTHNEPMSEAEKEPIVSNVADRLAARFPAAPRRHIEGIVGEE
jgi:hypothetical protein